jgi:hypothetical protein
MDQVTSYLELKRLLMQLIEELPDVEVLFGATVRADRLPGAIRPKDQQFVRIAARVVVESPDEVKYLLGKMGFEEISSSLLRHGEHLVSVQRPFKQQPTTEPEAPETSPQQPQRAAKKRTSLPS